MSKSHLTVLILAAGHGTRMKSHRLKLLHEAAGLRLIDHVRATAESLHPDRILFVIAPGMEELEQSAVPHPCVIQSPAKGTGHAVQVAMEELGTTDGIILVMLGDNALVTPADVKNLVRTLENNQVDAAFLAAEVENPFGLGRMVLENGNLIRIIEETEANDAQKAIKMINGGLVALRAARLPDLLGRLTDRNNKGEFYLTDLAALITADGRAAKAVLTSPDHIQGVNTRADLAATEAILQDRLRAKAMSEGVTLRDPSSIYLSMDTVFAKDVTIEPHVVIGKKVVLDEGTSIKSFSHLEDVHLMEGASVGPFARIRGGAVLEQGASIGNFVEVKKSRLGRKTKAAHLTYIGDSDVGDATNIGAGTITCNYDGTDKHKTIIGKNSFIGSNSTLVAPVSIGDGAFIAAGSTITDDVPADALALGRARQDVKTGWAAKRRKGKH